MRRKRHSSPTAFCWTCGFRGTSVAASLIRATRFRAPRRLLGKVGCNCESIATDAEWSKE